jgi:predicted anti-sigma-YlaC factor YlaD
MRCQDVECLILEAEERELGQEERLVVDEHLGLCPQCAAFREFKTGLRFSLRTSPAPSLPSDLDFRTRLACHAKLCKKTAEVPLMIWAGFAALTLFTVILLVPRLEGFWQSQKMTIEIGLSFIVLLQNALMLFFAPLVVGRQRFSRDKFAVVPDLGQGFRSGGSKWPLYQGK